MPDDAAARAAAEEESAFSHPAVDPDSTAAYGDHPDQVIDFYVPRGERMPGEAAPLVVVLHGGAWRAPYDRRHITPFADFLARRGFAVASVEYRRGPASPAEGASIPAQGGSAEGASGVSSRAAGPTPSTTSRRRWTRSPHSYGRPCPRPTRAARCSPGTRRAVTSPCGRRPGTSSPRRMPPGTPPPPPPARRRRPRPDRRLHGRREAGRVRRGCGPTPGRPGQVRRTPPVRRPLPPPPHRHRDHPRPGPRRPRRPSGRRRVLRGRGGQVRRGRGPHAPGGRRPLPLIDPAADACAVVAEEIAQLAW